MVVVVDLCLVGGRVMKEKKTKKKRAKTEEIGRVGGNVESVRDEISSSVSSLR